MMRTIVLMGLASALAFVATASAEITVGDPSFELHPVDQNGFSNITAPWVGVDGGWVASEGNYGLFNIPDGNIAASTSNDAIYQDLADTYELGKTYTLTAQAAARAAFTSQGSLTAWQIALHNGNTEEAIAATTGEFELIDSPDGPQAWQEIKVEYTATLADDGEPIRIYFGTGSEPNSTSDYRFIFDQVRLDDGGPGLILGDANGDTFVTEADLRILLDNYFITDPTPDFSQGNFDADQTVDENDYLIWETEFLAAGGNLADIEWFSVPEPSALVLLTFSSLAILPRRRGRS